MYNFEGLDHSKAKFVRSDWQPVYAITNESKTTTSTLYAIAAAFTVISHGTFAMKGFMKNGKQIILKQ